MKIGEIFGNIAFLDEWFDLRKSNESLRRTILIFLIVETDIENLRNIDAVLVRSGRLTLSEELSQQFRT